jgi:uncharacterized membrane protein
MPREKPIGIMPWAKRRRALRRLDHAKGGRMATLVAIGYPDEHTAIEAEKTAQKLAKDLVLQPDAIAAIQRHPDGKFKVTTSHHGTGKGATWGMFWGFFFGLLFFVPVFGMALGAGLGALFGKFDNAGIDSVFIDEVKDMVQPGTSALFLIVEEVEPDKAVEALSQYGGTVLKSSLSDDAQQRLQEALHGAEEAQGQPTPAA